MDIYSKNIAAACLAALAVAFAPQGHCKTKVVTTTFPLYDWTRNAIGAETNDFELVLLETSGADIHSFRPTMRDVKNMRECDVFVQIGGESDEWIDKALADGQGLSRKTVKVLDILGSEAVDDGDGDRDEHVWLSPRRAEKIAGAIAQTLAAAEPSKRETVISNATAYCAILSALDAEYAARLSKPARRTLVIADRNPLRYLTADYSLDAVAAFSGCGAESEASFKTVVSLAKKADSLGANALLVLENGNRRLAASVNRATKRKNLKTVEFDSLQSVSSGDVESGKTYLGAMRKNLGALLEALE